MGASLFIMRDRDKRLDLIEAAGRLFAEKGLGGTGVRAIVEEAGAALSSVNYHFGGKAGLHEACLEYVLRDKMKLKEIFADLENREVCHLDEVPGILKKFIRQLFYAFLNPENPEWYGQLISRSQLELHPQSEFNIVKVPEPVILRNFIKKNVPGVGEDESRLWVYSLVAQVQYYASSRSAVLLTFNKERYDADFIDSVSEFIAKSLLKTLGLPA